MEWFQKYKQQLHTVYTAAEEAIARFPAPLCELGLKYSHQFNPVDHENGKDYICTLLPYWIKEEAGISDEQCNSLALANVFGMLYFFIQDDVMDGTPEPGWKNKLALSSLLQNEMLRVLRGLFPSDSPFWSYYSRYVTEWADCVVNENKDNYFITQPLRTAGKAGPVKIASTGALLLSGKESRVPLIEEVVDIVLMSLQMSDDWADWKEDLQDGSYNGLLAMLRAEREADNITELLSAEQVETEIYVKGCLNRFVSAAKQNDKRLRSMQLSATELYHFHSFIVWHLSSAAERIDTNRDLLLKGGLNYFLATASRPGAS